MDAIRIRGGKRLSGKIHVSGAKNAALPILCATLLSEGESLLRNVPALRDIDTTAALLRFLGRKVDCAPPLVRVSGGAQSRPEAPYELVKQMRASVMVLGPLLARHGRAKVSLPGGCQIGTRPVDQHLKGRTTLVNCAREPEVEELGRVLNKMGARVSGAGTDVIHIEGADELEPFDHAIISDRIEAGTYMVAAAAAGGDVLLEGAPLEDLEAVSARLRQAGVEVGREGDCVRIRRDPDRPLRPVDVTTAPHPGFPTDMQAQFMVLMCLAQGTSRIVETIFENRFMHVPELVRMGAHIDVDGHTAHVHGGHALSGTTVMATDLRASASLVIAGLVAAEETDVLRVYHLDRGYEHMERKLAQLGADTTRIQSGL